ncbi:hypothetical protein DL767_006360 [Monosporascus sp. MG133]|nr:hypothetical protein DL767_006360 [Monosporascus sp. MG133]
MPILSNPVEAGPAVDAAALQNTLRSHRPLTSHTPYTEAMADSGPLPVSISQITIARHEPPRKRPDPCIFYGRTGFLGGSDGVSGGRPRIVLVDCSKERAPEEAASELSSPQMKIIPRSGNKGRSDEDVHVHESPGTP